MQAVRFWFLCCLFIGSVAVGWSQGPATTAPANVVAKDVPNDDSSKGIEISWEFPEPAPANFQGFRILRRAADSAEPEVLRELPPEARNLRDTSAAPPTKGETSLREKATAYRYTVRAVYHRPIPATETPAVPPPTVETPPAGAEPAPIPTFSEQVADSAETEPVTARGNTFHTGKIPILIATLFFGGLVVFLTERAKRGVVPKIRRIAGLEAVDEAIGRATEMGKPILYVPGIGGVSDTETVSAINIFSLVSKKAGEFGTRMRVPCADPIVMQVMRTVGEQAYIDIGRPDTFHEEDVYFLTDSQFAYAAGVAGVMVREKPSAIFLQGVFFAESLILAETGNSVGAIQIAGTASDSQLPFFIAACDYTLIGEELFAASAYLSRDPRLLSTIRAQDIAKLLLIAAIVAGVLLKFAGSDHIARFFDTASTL